MRSLPAPWRGALTGAFLWSTGLSMLSLYGAHLGWGSIADIVIGAALGLLLPTLGALLLAGLCWHTGVARAGAVGGALLGSAAPLLLALVHAQFPFPFALITALVTAALPALLGAAAGLFLQQPRRGALLLIAALLLNGSTAALAAYRPHYDAPPPGQWPVPESVRPIEAPNPAAPGPYPVRTLTYGSGADRRPEYRNPAIRTWPVDLSGITQPFTGLRQWAYQRLWSFDQTGVPINGRVWYPDGEGPFPLVVMAHGNHAAAHYSDPGYGYLGELLASRGFIFASIDENFLNSHPFFAPANDMPARAYLLLSHVDAWHDFNLTPGSPLHLKVNLGRIALMGHSRGGEAAAWAAAFNRMPTYPGNPTIALNHRFPIRTVIALAPSDQRYQVGDGGPALQDVHYLALQGGRDTDTHSFFGVRQYQRVEFTGEGWAKAAVWFDHVNHGQLSTQWRRDRAAPLRWFFAEHPLMADHDARLIAQVFVAAFLEATLADRAEYLPLFQDPRTGAHWLPGTTYAALYQGADFRPIASFEEDEVTQTATLPGARLDAENLQVDEVWLDLREGIPRRNRVAQLTWSDCEPVPTYTITLPRTLPDGWRLDLWSQVIFDLGVVGTAVPDLTVEVTDSIGNVARLPLQRFGQPVPQPANPITRFGLIDQAMYQTGPPGPLLQTFVIPLADFAMIDRGFNPEGLQSVRLRFDRTCSGSVVLDAIAINDAGR